MPRIKKSYGIICCRRGEDKGVEMVMVKKATTYYFCEFVAGHYFKDNENHIKKLLNNMTYHEKMDILTMRFQNLWYRIYMENPDKVFLHGSNDKWANSYFKKKSKFERTFISDGGKKIKRLVKNTSNSETPWEFPKGRKNGESEQNIDTAIREFTEETGISKDKFEIMWRLKPYVETYNDFGTTYQNTYYYAKALGNWEPIYEFCNKNQTSEVSEVKWVSKQDLKYMNIEKNTLSRLDKLFQKIIKKYKNYNKNR